MEWTCFHFHFLIRRNYIVKQTKCRWSAEIWCWSSISSWVEASDRTTHVIAAGDQLTTLLRSFCYRNALHGKEESLQAKIADEHTTVGCYLHLEKENVQEKNMGWMELLRRQISINLGWVGLVWLITCVCFVKCKACCQLKSNGQLTYMHGMAKQVQSDMNIELFSINKTRLTSISCYKLMRYFFYKQSYIAEVWLKTNLKWTII